MVDVLLIVLTLDDLLQKVIGDAKEVVTHRCQIRREEDFVLSLLVEVPEGVEFLHLDDVFTDYERLFFGIRLGTPALGFTELRFVHVYVVECERVGQL